MKGPRRGATLLDCCARSALTSTVWRKGDVILWDNIASMHARTDMPKDQRRVIRHCSVLGKVAPLAA